MSIAKWLTGGRAGGDVGTLARLDAELTELYHALAPVLDADQPASLAIASAEVGEGRTQVAVYVAEMLADQLEGQVLLVDAAARKPALHQAYDAQLAPGLADLLRGEALLAGLVQPTLRANLGLLAAGDGLDDHLLDRDGLQHVLEQAASYHAVVFDTAPLLDNASAVAVAQAVRGVLLVVRAGDTQGEILARAQRMLHRAAAELVGVVVNDPRGEFSRDEG
jgi:Mrp family chromosome partitioning ATPase